MKTEMEICGSCGVIAPTSNDSCSVCFFAFENNRMIVKRPEQDLQLVRLKGDFECRSCGARVALNHFTLDGYLCGSCGIEQQFNWDLWEQIIEHAHNTADLAGFNEPDLDDMRFWKAFEEEESEDIAAMFRMLGRSKTTLTKGNSYFGGLDFSMDVSPGNPLCVKCQKPLTISCEESSLRTNCQSCGSQENYALWSETEKYDGVVGCICGEHHQDKTDVKTETAASGAVVAIHCPHCGGDLKISGMGEIVECPYCSTSCHIPERLLQKLSKETIPKKTWWMVFRGKSKNRLAVEKKMEREAQKEVAERAREKKEALEEAEREIQAGKAQSRQNKILVITIFAVATLFAIIYFVAFG